MEAGTAGRTRQHFQQARDLTLEQGSIDAVSVRASGALDHAAHAGKDKAHLFLALVECGTVMIVVALAGQGRYIMGTLSILREPREGLGESLMNSFDQVPYNPDNSVPANIFADNPDPRCPVVLLLDKSGSMRGTPIEQLNEGLRAFQRDMSSDPLAARRIEVAIVSFGPITSDTDFITMDSFTPPTLHPEGDTPMGRAITVGLDMLAERKRIYRENGIAYFRPWIFLITDGAPTDKWAEAARRVREEETAKRVAFFAVGVEGADFERLAQISVREPIRLKGLRFTDLFKWLSASLAAVSRSQPGTSVALPAVRGWAEI